MRTAASTGAVLRLRRVEVSTLAAAKAAGLLNVAAGLLADRAQMTSVSGCLVLAGLLATASIGLVAGCVSAGRVRAELVTADLVFVAAALFANAWMVRPGPAVGWAYFAYPFALVSTLELGAAYRRFAVAATATAVLTAAYLAAGWIVMGRTANYLPNAVSFLALGPLAWGIDRELNSHARAADAERERAEALARGQERARHQRILHDRVLQTFDSLLRGERIADQRLRDHLATESAWLRHLVETGDERVSGDLVAALDAAAARAGRQGLKVQVNAAALAVADSPHLRLAREQTAALADAAAEALANVLKHSGADNAVVRARIDGGAVRVTVTDSGCGFDPVGARRVSGLELSVARRLAAVGGGATVDSAPGAGTSVELSVPLPQ